MRCIYKSCVKDLKIKKSRIVGFKGVLMKTKKLTKIAGVITLLALLQICYFQFINDCLQVFYKVKAGAFRTKNISKREWILDGESVLYANCDMINMCMLDIIKK